jgi:hypothetical protein
MRKKKEEKEREKGREGERERVPGFSEILCPS